jgi:hypothetical protein
MGDLPWSGLEKAKLAASFLTPLLVLILGIIINNSIKSTERSTALRSEIYRAIGGDLNDIYSYLTFVGGWKEMTPSDVIARKRAVDKAMYTYRPFFSKELFDTYDTFMREAFAPYSSAGADARIRSDIATIDGDRRFTKEDNNRAQREAYNKFLEQLARDLKL